MAALNFYAGGCYQRMVGKDNNLGLSQTSVHKCVAEVTDALNQQEILMKYIKFPSTHEDRMAVIGGFMEKFGFPGVVGCIDGTQIAILRPKECEEAYFNKKHYHSLNAMIICDANLNITHVDASYGGASNDSHIWNCSDLQSHLQSLHESQEACWLLGDSGYPQRDWLMTPIRRPSPNSPEAHYNSIHKTTRKTVEKCIVLLKTRWQCLVAHRKLHYDPNKAGKIVNACVVLHNMCNSAGVEVPTVNASDIRKDKKRQPPQPPVYDEDEEGSRQVLVERLWKDRPPPSLDSTEMTPDDNQHSLRKKRAKVL